MKKMTSKKFLFLFAVLAAGFSVSHAFTAKAASSDITKGKWELKDGEWKFYDEGHNLKTGWINTASGWYYLDPSNGNMLTKWQKINGIYYYFDMPQEGTAGRMHTSWYEAPDGKWYFFNNVDSDASQGSMLIGWQWVDGYCYYFETKPGKDYGSMYADKTTPDGFKTNSEGRWVDDEGKVQYVQGKGFSTQKTADNKGKTNTSITRSGGSGGGSGSRGGSGGSGGGGRNPKPSEPNKPEDPQKPSEPNKPDNPQKPSEPNKPDNPQKPSEPKKPDEPKKPEVEKQLADGTWYGTATWSRYIIQDAPNIVKVVIKDGKIENAVSERYTDDKEPKHFMQCRDKLLEKLKGSDSTVDILKQIEARKGFYDSISGATETVKGHISAVDNALKRSNKFATDKKEQNIDYMEFVTKPDAVAKGDTLDLTKSVLKLHLKNGEIKEVGFNDFEKYDIKTEPQNGTPLSKTDKKLKVRFINEASVIDIPVEIVLNQKILTKKYPTHIIVNYENGSDYKIDLDKNEWRYKIEAKGNIKGMSIYDNDKKLTDGAYDSHTGRWNFSLKDVPHDGFDIWGFNDYAVVIDTKNDNSGIASFKLLTENVKQSYYIGDNLNIDNLIIDAVTKNGNKLHLNGWEECKKAGFTSTPENNYKLTESDKGDKIIKISYNKDNANLEKTFSVKVEDSEVKAPAKIELYDKNTKIKELDIDADKLKQGQGKLILRDVEISEKYKNWNKDTFTIKAFNKAGNPIRVNVNKGGIILKIEFPDYVNEYGTSYVWITFKFIKDAPTPPEQSKLADGTWYGTGTWSRYYKSKGPDIVKVVVENGKIKDSESVVYTDDPENEFQRGKDILKFVKGLDSTESISKQLTEKKGDAYDAVSKATETAKGHLSAVDNALERSKKYKSDNKEQKIDYIEFETRPNPQATGSTLDLSMTVLKLHLKNEGEKKIGYDKFGEYGITTDPAHGSKLPPVGSDVLVHFKHADSLIDMPSNVQAQKKNIYRYPTKIIVRLEDGTEKSIEVNKNDFRYKFSNPNSAKIKGMDIYDKDEKLKEAQYIEFTKEWEFNLKDVNVGAGYTSWRYETYLVSVETPQENSPITGFTLDDNKVKRSYKVGESLDISELLIKAETQDGKGKNFHLWSDAQKAGFKSNPENGYKFTSKDSGKKNIDISLEINGKTVTKSFEVEVGSANPKAVRRIEIYTKLYKLIKKIEIEEGAFEANDGKLTFYNVEIPEEYKNWDESTFNIWAYADNNAHLKVEVDKRSNTICRIKFPEYKSSDGSDGYVMLGFKFVKSGESISQVPAKVELFDKGTKLADINISKTDFENSKAHLIVNDVVIPETYKGNWNKDTFTVKVYNEKNESLNATLVKSDDILGINLPDYNSPQFGKGYIGLKFKYEEKGNEEYKVGVGEAEVKRFRYKAKVKVKYNASTGEIISVEDNATVPGTGNKRFWNKAVAMFAKMPGKTIDTVDTVDVISGATLSSNAIKEAVKLALPKPQKPDETNMDVLDLLVDGKTYTYYYKKYNPLEPNEKLIVKGKDVTEQSKMIKQPSYSQVRYYVEDDQKLSGNLYGIADLPYAYFYHAELASNNGPGSSEGDPNIEIEHGIIGSYKQWAGYDVVSSATSANYGKLGAASYSEQSNGGYKINGVKTPVQIDAQLYVKVKILAAVNAKYGNQFIPMVTSMTGIDNATGEKRTVTSTEPAVYKKFYYDGTLSALEYSDNASELHVDASALDISVTDQSSYGDYQINIKNLPSEIDATRNVLGVIFCTDYQDYPAKRYGLSHLDNIWTDAGQLAFSVSQKNYGSENAHRRFATLAGHRITKLTYLLSDNKKVVIENINLYLGRRLSSGQEAKIVKQTGFEDGKGAEVTFDLSNLPYRGYEVKSLKFGIGEEARELVKDTDYTFDSDSYKLSIMATASTGEGKYTVIFGDTSKKDAYVSSACEFELKKGEGPTPEPETKTLSGEADVEGYNYTAKVNVTYNTKTGEIVSVEDDGTEATGMNYTFWTDALKMLPKFTGKKKADLDGLKADTISGATISSKAIIEAVKNALSRSKIKAIDASDINLEYEDTDAQLNTEAKAILPTHVVAVYADGNTEKIELEETNGVYSVKIGENVIDMALYSGDEKLADGIYSVDKEAWEFNVNAGGLFPTAGNIIIEVNIDKSKQPKKSENKNDSDKAENTADERGTGKAAENSVPVQTDSEDKVIQEKDTKNNTGVKNILNPDTENKGVNSESGLQSEDKKVNTDDGSKSDSEIGSEKKTQTVDEVKELESAKE